ncbi:MAG TPA: YoaK family protein [Asticcacaulis sp.]|nr:YoaK family protein [Asticcacaulis sp.]
MVRTALLQLSGKHRSDTGDARLGVILAFIAGAVNAGGFLAIGYYTSHMSGMVSSVADFLVAHRWTAAGLAIVHILSFFSGSMTASLIINWARKNRLNSEFAAALMAEAGLLLLFGGLAAAGAMHVPAGLHAMISLLCFIMGLQNGLITKISHAEIRTTHMTGIITDLGIEIGRLIFGAATHSDVRYNPRKVRRLAALLVSFLSGGVMGATIFSLAGFVGVVPFALLLAVLAAQPIIDDLTRQS